MNYILLVIAIFAATFCSLIMHRVKTNNKRDVFVFNLIASIAWFLILLVLNKFTVQFDCLVLLFGIIYGVTQVIFIVFKLKAMETGPVSVTTLVGNCSLVLSTLVGVIAWDERISLLQVVGIVLLIVSVIISTDLKGAKGSYQKGWKLFAIGFFVFAALIGIVFKAFAKNGGGGKEGDMMLIASGVMVILLFIITLIISPSEKGNPIPFMKSFKTLLPVIICGALMCTQNRINVAIAGDIPAPILYPVFNGGVIILSSVLSVLLLKEKTTVRQKLGIALGVVAIVIAGVF